MAYRKAPQRGRPPSDGEELVVTTIKLTSEMKERLRLMARREQRTMGAQIRKLIQDALYEPKEA